MSMDYWIHVGCGFYLLLFSILAFYWERKLRRLPLGDPGFQSTNQIFFYFNRVAMYVTLLAFIIGGKRGTPFFKAGTGWIYSKLALWLILMTILGVLSAKALKMRKKARALHVQTEALENPEEPTLLLDQARKKMNLFLCLNLPLVLLLMALGYFKWF